MPPNSWPSAAYTLRKPLPTEGTCEYDGRFQGKISSGTKRVQVKRWEVKEEMPDEKGEAVVNMEQP